MSALWLRRWSTAKQALVMTAVLVVGPVATILVIDSWLLYTGGVREAEQILKDGSEELARTIDRMHEVHIAQSRLIAGLPELRRYCESDVEGRAAAQASVRELLSAFSSADPDVAAAVIVGPEGLVWASSLPGGEGVGVRTRSFFAHAVVGQTTVSDPFLAPAIAGDSLVVGYLTVPQANSGGPACMVGVFARMENTTLLIAEAGGFGGTGSFAVLLDPSGIRLARSDGKYVLRPSGPLPEAERAAAIEEGRFGPQTASVLAAPAGDPKLFELSREEIGDGRAFWGSTAGEDEPALTIARRLQRVPWTLAVRVPRSTVLAPVFVDLGKQLFAILLVGSFAGTAIWLVARAAIRRLAEMASTADAIAGGRLDLRVDDLGADELADVGRRFNAMVSALGQQQATLEGRVEDRTAALTLLNTELEAQKNELIAQWEELHAQAAEIERKSAQVEQADRLKSEFLSNVSHELRTPLNAVIGFSDLLLASSDPELSAEHRSFADAIGSAGRHQLALINDILDFSKIESGYLTLSPESVPVDESIALACDSIRVIASRRNVVLEIKPAESMRVLADPRRLHQILLNLLSNAVKFSPEGGSVELSWNELDNMVAVEVADRGPGIPDALWPLLFEPFQQAASPLVKQHEGTGLGLAISRRLVRMQGGELGAAARFGGGLVLRFTLPRSGPEDALAQADGHALSAAPDTVSGRSVLLIDDDPAVSRLLGEMLASRGMDVRHAATGAEGLAMVAHRPPDVVIVDLRLPDTTGLQVVASIRGTASGRSLPLLVFTAADLSEDGQRALKGHGAVVVQKGQATEADVVMAIQRALSGTAPDLSGGSDRGVLVVDDHDLNRVLVRATLERAGIVVREAASATEAFHVIAESRPGLILMDLAMPGIDGYEAIVRLKGDVATADIPIVALTALAMRRDEVAALEAGADAFLTKPFNPARLVKLVREFLNGTTR